MPTLFIAFGLRFFFWTREHTPIHVHVENADGVAKFEVYPEVVLKSNNGIKKKDLRIAQRLVEESKDVIIERWKEVIGD